jgi:predicted enzyme related to lactoylglutathione lyase
MIKKISHMVLYAADQDEALAFYRDNLGFKVHTDVLFEGVRWLSMQAPEQKELEVIIAKAQSPAAKALIGNQSPDIPFLVLTSSDCEGDYEALKKSGVTLLTEPTLRPWGMAFQFKDLYGNVIHLVEPQ